MSRAGGLTRVRLHGNPGTAAGRKLGGLHSLATHRLRKTGFKLLKHVAFPPSSVALAELCGILAGDGHIGTYQTSVATNSVTDIEHAVYVKSLFEKLFKLPAPLAIRKKQKACAVVVSSKEVGRFLVGKGMVQGNKIHGGLQMPSWIRHRKSYETAFVRGLFDTDGCVYVDVHRIRGRIYKNIGMAFTNRCLPLLADFRSSLERHGLHPTQKTKYAVFLRREKDIQRYFAVVGSSNPKHLRKVAGYFSHKGGVA